MRDVYLDKEISVKAWKSSDGGLRSPSALVKEYIDGDDDER